MLRSDGGFLAASHRDNGPAIFTVTDPTEAVGFVDYTTAINRARTLIDLGWRNIRIIETLIY